MGLLNTQQPIVQTVNIHMYMEVVFEERPLCGQTCFELPNTRTYLVLFHL